jgi:hypothetical protein
VAFDAYPMHEMAAHPDAATLFGLFNRHSPPLGRGGTSGCAPPSPICCRPPPASRS